jgi:hypothetical protein
MKSGTITKQSEDKGGRIADATAAANAFAEKLCAQFERITGIKAPTIPAFRFGDGYGLGSNESAKFPPWLWGFVNPLAPTEIHMNDALIERPAYLEAKQAHEVVHSVLYQNKIGLKLEEVVNPESHEPGVIIWSKGLPSKIIHDPAVILLLRGLEEAPAYLLEAWHGLKKLEVNQPSGGIICVLSEFDSGVGNFIYSVSEAFNSERAFGAGRLLEANELFKGGWPNAMLRVFEENAARRINVDMTPYRKIDYYSRIIAWMDSVRHGYDLEKALNHAISTLRELPERITSYFAEKPSNATM